MKRLTQFLNEMAVMSSQLDQAWIAKAARVKTFSLQAKDFKSLEYKAEIQHLFETYFFKTSLAGITIKGKPTTKKLNNSINKLKRISPRSFENLRDYMVKGIGPAEVLLYVLLDEGYLSGANAPFDMMAGGGKYEIKSVDLNKEGFLKNFKIGGTMPLGKIQTAGLALKAKVVKEKLAPKNDEETGITTGQMEAIMKHKTYKTQWKNTVETPFKTLVSKYMSGKNILFIVNKTPKARKGEVLHIGPITANQISVDKFTSDTIKPKVKL